MFSLERVAKLQTGSKITIMGFSFNSVIFHNTIGRYLLKNISFVTQMCQPQEQKTPSLFRQAMGLWLAHKWQ